MKSTKKIRYSILYSKKTNLSSSEKTFCFSCGCFQGHEPK